MEGKIRSKSLQAATSSSAYRDQDFLVVLAKFIKSNLDETSDIRWLEVLVKQPFHPLISHGDLIKPPLLL